MSMLKKFKDFAMRGNVAGFTAAVILLETRS